MKTTTLIGAISLLLVCLPLQALAQISPTNSEVKEIRREMDQLRRDYERRMQLLEQRLNRIESPATVAGTNSAPAVGTPEPAAVAASGAATVSQSDTNHAAARQAAIERGREFAREQFQQDAEKLDRNIAPATNSYLKQRVEQVLQDFVDISGYARAGYGRDNKGGPQTGFQAPGALAKYRLGNEAENYAELAFGKNWYVPGIFSTDPNERPNGTPTGPIARTQVRVSMYDPYSAYNSSSGTQFTVPEVWASVGNVVASQPSMKFWAGDRYYERSDIHINDFFFRNMSGGGGGVEDVQLPFGQVAMAWIGSGSESDLYTDYPAPDDPANSAGFSKGNWDFLLYDVTVPLGKGEFNFIYANTDTGLDQNGNSLNRTDGFAIDFIHLAKPLVDPNSFNMFSLQIGNGPAKTFTSGFETFTYQGKSYIRPDPNDSWRFRATEHFVVQPIEHLSIGPALVYQYTDYGEGYGRQTWFSAGLRPIVEFNRYFSLAFEGGVDYVDDSYSGTTGNLFKLTLAPQVALGNRFFSRPVLRAYVTYAQWSDGFVGQVGGQDYQSVHGGLTYGLQMETWW
ncbi:MAG: carbohydrate porin [Verrucomicrobia bacterium]|nr:carbohydrate porin [Verrucomicrobiota bacterium]